MEGHSVPAMVLEAEIKPIAGTSGRMGGLPPEKRFPSFDKSSYCLAEDTAEMMSR